MITALNIVEGQIFSFIYLIFHFYTIRNIQHQVEANTAKVILVTVVNGNWDFRTILFLPCILGMSRPKCFATFRIRLIFTSV